MAKSLLCVQNIAKIPALPKFIGLLTNSVMTRTVKNTSPFAMSIDNRNNQFTELKSNWAKDIKISDGSEKVPTNILIPFASVSETIFIRPAM